MDTEKNIKIEDAIIAEQEELLALSEEENRALTELRDVMKSVLDEARRPSKSLPKGPAVPPALR